MSANNAQSKVEDKEIFAAYKKGLLKDGETIDIAYCRHYYNTENVYSRTWNTSDLWLYLKKYNLYKKYINENNLYIRS